MMVFKKLLQYCCVLLLILEVTGCDKVNITFGAADSETDPNITYFDNYKTDIATYKVDSFVTSGHKIFTLGYHNDPVFGVVRAGSYAQISLPGTNPLKDLAVTLDSLELIIKPSGQFYGDSAAPMKINVYRLNQNIKDNINGDTYYNTRSFGYDPTPIGQQTVNLYGKTGSLVHIRLSDALGQELMDKFRTSDNVVSADVNFVDYFRGLYINTDTTVTKSLAYFNSGNDSLMLMMRLNYHENGLFVVEKQFDFDFVQAKQFNNIAFRYTNPSFSAFVDKKKQLIESTASGNQSFLNSNLGSCIKISFPTLLNLKELHPYIKIVKALLVVKPDLKSSTFPYTLPATLSLYSTDNSNAVGSPIYDGTAAATGNLVIDPLYSENTYYSYDITSFINTKITDGQFSQSALLLYPSLSSNDVGLQRLIVNDQTNTTRSVQLKLYVLGL